VTNSDTLSLRHDWRLDEVESIYGTALPDLIYRAQTVHRAYHRAGEVQGCSLLSIKTGGCPEDCAYCPQAARYRTGVEREDLLDVETVRAAAAKAKAEGATRFCMGGAWRCVPDGAPFDRLLEMVGAVRSLGMEACLTAGMLRRDQADRLADAGLSAYNHNLDTGEGFYGEVVSTRTYADRLKTLDHVRAAGIDVCCGGILGMGESDDDRIDLFRRLATFDPHPESVPINLLVAVEGTPLAGREKVDPLALVRAVAVARILMPSSRVRLSAGRRDLSDSDHALCFLAGANSIFAGDRLLTTANVEGGRDADLLARLGLRTLAAAEIDACAAPAQDVPAAS